MRIHRSRSLIVCSLLAFAATNAFGQQSKPPEVLVVATGGTIASTGNYYGDRGGPVNKISV